MRDRERRGWRSRTSRYIAGALLMLAALALPAPPGGAAQTDARVDRAVKLIAEGSYGEAIQLLDAVLAESDDDWEAHYQKGRALGLRGDMQAALPSLLRALELRPGMAHAHELAAVAAWETGQRSLAWDQVALAYLGGGDVEGLIQRMAAIAPPPADFLERLSAPRVIVAPLDLQEIEARAETPFNRNPLERADPSRSGVPESVQGRELVQESWADLRRVHRQFQASIAASPAYGLVLDERLAEYRLRIAVDELSADPPRSLAGYLELIAVESGAVGYRRAFSLRQIGAAGELRGQIELIVADLEAWLRKLRADTQ